MSRLNRICLRSPFRLLVKILLIKFFLRTIKANDEYKNDEEKEEEKEDAIINQHIYVFCNIKTLTRTRLYVYTTINILLIHISKSNRKFWVVCV